MDKVEVTETETCITVKTTTEYGTYIYSELKRDDSGISSETKEEGRQRRIEELRKKYNR